MSGNERKLTPKQLKAIETLLLEPTTKAAALQAGVSEATLFRWLKEKPFSLAYREARSRLLESALTTLQSASAQAVGCLRTVMADEASQPGARVSAARTVLELTLKAKQTIEFEERLAVLEQALKQEE